MSPKKGKKPSPMNDPSKPDGIRGVKKPKKKSGKGAGW